LLCGEHEEALKRIEASVENGYPFHAEPLPLLRSLVALAAGDDRAAAKAMADGYPGALAEAGLGEVLQRCFAAVTGRGSCEIAVASLDRLMKLPVAQDAASVVGLATVLYTRLGSIDGAYRMAELLASQVESGRTISPMLGIFWHCELEAFRDDPRFIPLAEQLGFIEHWRRYGGPDCWSPDKAAADKVIERAASA
jgi:hypothetical protein